jgi:hypothetical protein
MATPNRFLLEGIDRTGKDTLVEGIQNRRGYHLILHYTKPPVLDHYSTEAEMSPERQYQEASFRTMFEILRNADRASVICNRAHLGECVYAPMYRGYSGDYVFELERAFNVHALEGVRLILLTEDFDRSRHFSDDGRSLGSPDDRRRQQDLFLGAFEGSTIADKRLICVTDRVTGEFRDRASILDEALS